MKDHVLPTILICLATVAAVSTSAFYFGTIRKPLPFPNQERLEQIFGTSQQINSNRAPTSFEDWRDLRRDARLWDDIALTRATTVGIEQDGRSVLLEAARVTANLPSVLGVELHMGSGFVGRPGEEPEDQVIISHRLWRNAFNGGDVIGTRQRIGGADRTIVGVLPPDVRYPAAESDIWLPLRPAGPELNRNFRFTRAIGVRKQGVAHGVAAEELRRLAADLERRYPDDNAGFSLESVPLLEALLGGYRKGVMSLLVVSGLLLLLAVVNISGLAASRVMARRTEFALRRALGAGALHVAWSVARWLAVPTLVACVVASFAAFAVRQVFPATGGIADSMLEAGGGALPWIIGVVAAVLLWTVGSVGPAAMATRTAVSAALRGGSKGASHQRFTVAAVGLIATVQVALAATSAIAGLSAMSAALEMQRTELGLQGDLSSRMLAPLSMPADDPAQLASRVDAAAENLARIPGVVAAGIVSRPPLLDGLSSVGFEVAGSENAGPQSNATADVRLLAGNASAALGLRRIDGRYIEATDAASAQPVVVIDELFAARYFPRGGAVGKQVKFGPPIDRAHTVVGIVGSAQLRQLTALREPAVYLSAAQIPAPPAMRTPWAVIDGATVTLPQVVGALAATSPDIAVGQLESVDARAKRMKGPTLVAATVLGAAALLAMLIGLAGAYAALRYATALRDREVSIRYCLGATQWQVFQLLATRGAMLAAVGTLGGVLLGCAGLSLANAFGESALLVQQQTRIVTLAGALAFAAALVAVGIPALSGLRVQASEAMRP